MGACATPARTHRLPRTASDRALLNSERIEQRFGSYGIEVLESDSRVRVSNLFSVHDGHRICRTFAVVMFARDPGPGIAEEHRLIVAGGSIGAVFASRGWTVHKRPRLSGEVPMPEAGDRLAALMGVSGPGRLAIDVYSLFVSREGPTIGYATIAEVHHPDYLDLAELRALHGRPVPAEPGHDAELAELLDLVAAASRGPLAVTALPAPAGGCRPGAGVGILPVAKGGRGGIAHAADPGASGGAAAPDFVFPAGSR
jgi:hypothetical protein